MSRITPGTLIVAIFAVLFGLVGAYAAKKMFSQPPAVVEKTKNTAPADPFVNVPLTSTALKKGRELKLGDIVIYRVKQSEAKKYTKGSEFMTNPQQIIGRILSDDLPKGTVFKADVLYPEGTGPTIAEMLGKGERARTIPVRGTGILGGLAPPGSVVDVLFRSNETPTKEIAEATITLLHGVRVLAVQENTTLASKNPRSVADVTLAVAPSQVTALTIVEGRGEFSLALRSPDDESSVNDDLSPQTLEGLLGIRRTPPLPPPPSDVVIETYRGTERGLLRFSAGKPVIPPPPPVNGHPFQLSPSVSPAVKNALPPELRGPNANQPPADQRNQDQAQDQLQGQR